MSCRACVVRRFLGDGEGPLTGDDFGTQFSSFVHMARGSGELKRSSLSSSRREGERANRVEVVMIACSIPSIGR
jgi:hypothetical protein